MRYAASKVVGSMAVAAGVALASSSAAATAVAPEWSARTSAVQSVRVPDPQVLRPDRGSEEMSSFGAVDIDGDLMVVGDSTDDTNGHDAGAVYVYEQADRGWIEQAKIFPAEAAADDGFGWSVGVSGRTIVAQGSNRGAGGRTFTAAIFVFELAAGRWTQTATLLPPPDAGDDVVFGRVVIDGDTVVVGAPTAGVGVGDEAGAAYVFARADGGWALQSTLTGPAQVEGHFGTAVAVDGDTALVGAPDVDFGAEQTGAAYVFTRSGATWQRAARLTSPHPAKRAVMGGAVALDGDTAVVGIGLYELSGTCSTYVFVGSGSTWTLQTEFPCPFSAFGRSVAVDGDTLAIGSSLDSAREALSGAAFLSTRTGQTWTPLARLKAPHPSVDARYGSLLALDSGTLAVTEFPRDHARVYVYDR